MFRRKTISAVLFLCLISQSSFAMNPFDSFKEITLSKSPESQSTFNFEKKQEIIDFAVLADNSGVAVLVKQKKETNLVFWKYKMNAETMNAKLPDDVDFTEIAAHPQDQKVFILGRDSKKKSRIFTYAFGVKVLTEFYSDSGQLSNLIASSSKFDGNFRLFFARKDKKGTETVSITDAGERLYPVVSNRIYKRADWMKDDPKVLLSPYGVPVTFNPLGNTLLWYNKKGEIFALPYAEANWGKLFVPDFALHFKKGESIEFSPNGMYLLHWSKRKKDLMLVNNLTLAEKKLLTFESKPESKIKFTPDGKGIVYAPKETQLVYMPLDLPLYDVENAWMYCVDDNDVQMFSKNGALYRPANNEQMFNIYYSENYDPTGKSYVAQLPARPYLVTAEPFYETLSAAFSGIFYLNEKTASLNLFRQFISDAKKLFASRKTGDVFWANLFENASNILEGNYDNLELLKVKNCDGVADSKVLQREGVNFIEFKTRGYYEQDDAMNGYFKAVRYLSMARPTEKQWAGFRKKANVNLDLRKWMDSYRPFVAPSQQVLPDGKAEPLSYVRHRKAQTTLVPKPWGIDSEMLDSLVFHQDWPADDRVVDENGSERSVPDIYELAYIFGSNFAEKLLDSKEEYTKFPGLAKIHNDLIKRWKRIQAEGATGIYNKWLNLVSVQLSGKKPDWPWITQEMWETKQLQTGLSGWTNLRHYTYIFNEMENLSVDDGVSGFELLSLKPPRGAVEPFPEAFGALIAVFKELKNVCGRIPPGAIQDLQNRAGANSGLEDGIAAHIDNVIKNLEIFKRIAEKERNKEPLTNGEYYSILACGGAAEHDFLTFNSISTMNLGLAVPKAIPKCVDVYGDTATGILYSCIGFPLEWDVAVPYFGRREIVKGCSYLHSSFAVAGPVTDDEWYEEIKLKPKYPDWLNPYLSKNHLSCPAKIPFVSAD